MGAFQIKAMLFEVAKHLFDPHPALVSRSVGALIGQVYRQQSRFGFAGLPVQEKVGGMSVQLCQRHLLEPAPQPGSLEQTA
jgi:hypothetical protein